MTKSVENSEQPAITRKYQKIDKEQRKVVLALLQNEKMSLQEVANRLSLKYCTVRTIQKAYEKDGRIGKKETRKKKLKVENVLKISILNPLTLQVQPVFATSDISQIYVDKQLTASDQMNLLQEQKQLVSQQYSQLFQTLHSQFVQAQSIPNLYYQSTIQNLLLSSQLIFKQILDPQGYAPIKQYCEPVTPLVSGFPLPLQPPLQFHPQHYPYLTN